MGNWMARHDFYDDILGHFNSEPCFPQKWLIQTTSKGKEGIQSGSKAVEILKERYARGEIAKEGFEAK